MKGEIIISGHTHPVRFTMGAIEAIFIGLQIDDFSQLAEKMDITAIGKALKSTRVIAFEGVKAGYKYLAVPCPFKDIEDFTDAVTNFNELTPAIGMFTDAVNEFFKTDEPQGEVTGAGMENPSLSES